MRERESERERVRESPRLLLLQRPQGYRGTSLIIKRRHPPATP